MHWLLLFSDYVWVFSDKYTRNIPIYATLIFFSVFEMVYEPLDGSVVSINLLIQHSDDLNVSSYKETVTLETKTDSNGVDNQNQPISTRIPNKKPIKTQQELKYHYITD